MANLREAYAATALASLEWDENLEKSIDRVAAAGRAPELGILLWRTKYLNESAAYFKARKLLLTAFVERYRSENVSFDWEKPGIAERCVEESFSEFLAPACDVCNGKKEMLHEGLKILCLSPPNGCGGSGVKRYSDMDRARRMQLSLARVRVLNGKLTWLARELGTFDRQANSAICAELERE